MVGASIFIFIGLGICGKWGSAQFLNNRPFPTYSLEDMPDTDFSCRDKILGGYYADSQTQCQMFHVCVKVAGVGVQDFRFLCPNSTAFDQEHQICADWEDVDCDASTLYYSSDNFDLYRIGSGYESKAVKYGEEEEPFALQRAETGDIRLNREHQTQRVNQQKDRKISNRVSAAQQYQQTNQKNNNYNSNDNEKDIFKVSSSSNFFNNRNAGKETDDYDDDTSNVNANQNDDRVQRRKLIRKPINRSRYEEPQTQTASPPTGFINNFAGSSYTTTSRTIPTTFRNEQYSSDGGKQRQRGNYHYTKQDTGRYQEDDGQYRAEISGQYNNNNKLQYTVSTPAPFRRQQPQQQRQNSNDDQYSTTTATERSTNNNYNSQNYPSRIGNGQTADRQTQNYPSIPFEKINKEANNYPIKQDKNFPSPPLVHQPHQAQTYSPAPFKETQNYASVPFEKLTKETENYPSTPFKQEKNYPSTPYTNQAKQTQTYPPSPFKEAQSYSPTPFQKPKESDTTSTTFRSTQDTIAPFHKENRVTETALDQTSGKTSGQFKPQTKEAHNYPVQEQIPQKQTNKYDSYSTQTPVDNTQYQSNYEITKNKQSEYSSTQNFKKPTTFAKPGEVSPTTFSPKVSPFKAATFSESYSPTIGYKNSPNQQSNNYQTNYNQQNTGTRQGNSQASYNTYNQQQQTNRQTTQKIEYKQTTQHTHYTPTVPRITTPYHSSTTTAPSSKRANRYDETQYDDGSYNPKYDNDDGNDEVLKTAHSTNFASSRNEYAQNTKNQQTSQTDKPRPFSVTPNPPRPSTYPKSLPSDTYSTQNLPSSSSGSTNGAKKPKDTAYDYAYYDTNSGHEHDYDIGIDIEKSNGAKNKKSA